MTRKQNAFTLVEILIVVIILGILAAIVIPQFTSASDDAQAARKDTDLQALRTQVQLFKAEIERYPGCTKAGAIDAALDFATELTSVVANQEGVNKGPWLQDFPTNPTTGSNAVTMSLTANVAVDNNVGWIFDYETGKVYAADDLGL